MSFFVVDFITQIIKTAHKTFVIMVQLRINKKIFINFILLELVKKYVCKAVSLPKVQKYTAEVYEESEIQQLLNAIKGTDMELPLMIDINLGLRRGELLALKWKDNSLK